jgi:hypothetical protein
VARDSRADRVALNQSLRIPISPANAAGGDITPAMSIPSASDQTIGNAALTISKSRYFPFSWTGEEQKSVNYGPGFLTLKQAQIVQAIRAAINEVETDLAVAAKNGASRAYGTAAATPFGTANDFTDASNVLKILDDNGAPQSDRHLILNTTAIANLRGKQSGLFHVNEAGNDDLLRRGIIGKLMNFDMHTSAQVSSATAGTMASATSTSAAFTVGQTVIPLATAGTGVVAAGDVITFANDTNKYVIASVSFAGANPASGDSITLNAPGLRLAQGAATRAITVVATSARNIALSRNGILLATRLPAVPEEGDLATDRMEFTDEVSGLSLEFAIYPGFRMNVYHVGLAWGVKVIKPEHVAVLLG